MTVRSITCRQLGLTAPEVLDRQLQIDTTHSRPWDGSERAGIYSIPSEHVGSHPPLRDHSRPGDPETTDPAIAARVLTP
jgi:hypothetical protein